MCFAFFRLDMRSRDPATFGEFADLLLLRDLVTGIRLTDALYVKLI